MIFPCRGCLLSLFSSLLLHLLAKLGPPLHLTAEPCCPTCTGLHAQLLVPWQTTCPEMHPGSCHAAGAAGLGAAGHWEGMGLFMGWKKAVAKGIVVPSMSILAYFEKLDGCLFCCQVMQHGGGRVSIQQHGRCIFILIWRRKQIQNWEIWKRAETFMLGVWEVKKNRKKAFLNDKFTPCWAEWPGELPCGEGEGSSPSAVCKQAMKPRKKGVDMSGKLEISSEGLRRQSLLDMGVEH